MYDRNFVSCNPPFIGVLASDQAKIFITSTFLFIPLGIELGRNFAKFPSLISYSINILGSLIGLIFFGVLSYFSTPPILWFSLGFGFLILIHGGKKHLFLNKIDYAQ